MALSPRPLVVGVDPGLSGAIAFYNYETKLLESVHDMPTKKRNNGRNEIDVFALTQIFDRRWVQIEIAVIEEVGSMPNDGAVQAFAFGYATGIVTGILGGYNIQTIRTPPSVWKLMVGLTSDKNLSRSRAAKLFPELAPAFARKKDDGRAEAAILAHFAQRFLG